MQIGSLKNKLYSIKYNYLLKSGASKGLIQPFEPQLLKRLKNIYYGSVPISVFIGNRDFCNGKCYDRSMLISMGMDDFLLMRGKVKSLEIQYGKEKSGHGWVESNGWVYDTSMGFKVEKNLYYKLEQPTDIESYTKEDCLKDEAYMEILNSKINKYSLTCIVPLLEGIAQLTKNNQLIDQIEEFKDQISYDCILQDVETDFQKTKTNYKC